MIAIVLNIVLPWLLIALGAWLGYQLVRQNGRILLKLESIEKQLRLRAGTKQHEAARLPAGLLLGAAAPDFELPDLAGVRRKLSQFRGKEVLLIFFSPQCGFCTKMAADLAALSGDGAEGRAVPVVVTTGDAEENRKLVQQFGIRCVVLLQEKMEVASMYCAQGTPMGYRIDAEGRIASELAVGAESILALADLKASRQPTGSAKQNASPHKSKHPDPSLTRSKLNRSGLKAGAAAPDFSLPCLSGGELSLADFRGRRILLVFSDPNCGPCDELAPLLQELHEQRPDLQVLVISRRDAEATRTKADALGMRFPIVMQQQWEISKQYGMFATPFGYLIDERGIVVRDVAAGVEPIMALADEPLSAAAMEPRQSDKEVALTT
jgi:peroxiredoxin